ncbi:MAG: hypothetical protein ACFFE5_14705, partial [Candidatus Thorarchaeota archaeon]
MKKSKSSLSKSINIIFITSSLTFNISVSLVYIATKLGNMELLRVGGIIVILLLIPFTIALIGYIKEKEDKKILISLVIILFYLLLELFLDYIFLIPFRDMLALHIFYIIIFYAAEFSMIGVTFNISKKMGIIL